MRAKEFENSNDKDKFVEMFRKFLPLAMKVIGLKSLPKMVFEESIESDDQPTFGKYVNDKQILHIALANRHPNDILRTLAHELVHYKQDTMHELDGESGNTGSPEENEAHAVAGVVMRHFNKQYPEYLKTKPIVFESAGDRGDIPTGPGEQLIPFPPGTTMIDVSDVYDWYKLGMVISDLDDADPKIFGKGAPHTVIAFGSEEEEHKLLPLLKRLGLSVHDIDRPEDVKKVIPAKMLARDLAETIRKVKGGYRLVAKSGRNLGTYPTHAGAEKRERQVQYFKHVGERLNRTGSDELVIFDIDDTLLHTTAQIKVIKDGKPIRSLTNQEFNNYKLGPGEEFDFGEFRNAQKFEEESVPIGPMLEKLKQDLSSGKNVVMLTARADFDNQKAVWRTFKRHGIDINRDVHLFRAGNLPGDESPAVKKAIHVSKWLGTDNYRKIVMYDDSEKNLTVFKSLQKRFPDVEFEAHHVSAEGETKQVESWSEKYKRSINCSNPKGFSQRAHCQGRKKNVGEQDEQGNSIGYQKLKNELLKAISEQKIDRIGIREIDTGSITNFAAIAPIITQIIVSNALKKANKEKDETLKMAKTGYKYLTNQPVTPEENEAMKSQFNDLFTYGLIGLGAALTGGATGTGIAIAGVYKKELLDLIKNQSFELIVDLLKNKGKTDIIHILISKFLAKNAMPYWPDSSPAKDLSSKPTQGVAEGIANPFQQILMALRQDAGRYIDTRGQAGGRNFVLDINQRLAQLERTGNPRSKVIVDTITGMIRDAQRSAISTKGLSFGTLANVLMDLTQQELQKISQQDVAEGAMTADEYRDHLLKTYRSVLKFLNQGVVGWKPNEQHMLAAIDAAYEVMKETGDIKKAAQKIKDTLLNFQKIDQAQGVDENFADGRNPGRKGLAKRSGVNCKQSVTALRKIAKNSSGERQRMAHWCANMKSGKKK